MTQLELTNQIATAIVIVGSICTLAVMIALTVRLVAWIVRGFK